MRVVRAALIMTCVFVVTSIAMTLAAAEGEPPEWMPDTLPDGVQDEYYWYKLTATDPDDGPENLTYSDDCAFIDISADAELEFEARNEHVGRNHFNVTVTDDELNSDTMELELLVVNVNDPPILIHIPDQYADEDEVFTLDVSEYVDDPDLHLPVEFRDHLTYRDDSTKLDTNIETGVVTWDAPTNDDVGDHYFTVSIQDSKGRYVAQELRITVNNTNDAPEIGTIMKQTLKEEQPYFFSIPYVDDDLDIYESPEELTFSNDRKDLFTIDPSTGTIDFTPVNAQVGSWVVKLMVTDRANASSTRTVVFEVLNENDPPEIEYIRAQDLTEDVAYNLTVSATDPDMEPRLVDGLPVDPDEKLTFRTNSTVVPIDPQTGEISFTPGDDEVGTYMVKITVVDSDSTSFIIDVLFTIENVNDPPGDLAIIGLVAGETYGTDEKYTLMAQARDVDNPEDQLTYIWFEGTILIGQTKDIEWTPRSGGVIVMRLVVSDPDGGEATHEVSVTVEYVEPAHPVPTSITNDTEVESGEELRFEFDLTDVDADDVFMIIVASNIDGELATFTTDEQVSFSTRDLAPGEHVINVTVRSGDFSRTYTYLVTVEEKVESPGPAAAVALAALLMAAIPLVATRRSRG